MDKPTTLRWEVSVEQLADATEKLCRTAREALPAMDPECFSRLNLRDACNVVDKCLAEYWKQVT